MSISIEGAPKISKPKPKTRAYRQVAINVRDFSDIHDDLNRVQCTLMCASLALGRAQDIADHEIGAKAWRVIHACVSDLAQLDSDLDSWDVSHVHSPREMNNV